jgi:NAD-dependent DNA ligase
VEKSRLILGGEGGIMATMRKRIVILTFVLLLTLGSGCSTTTIEANIPESCTTTGQEALAVLDKHQLKTTQAELDEWMEQERAVKQELEFAEKRRRIDPPPERPKTIKWCDPDGEITFTGKKQDICQVNLGREDGVKTGFIFEVFKYVKGGRRKSKGRIEIVKIENTCSQAAIIETINLADDPIVKGDHIISPFFDKHEVKKFLFVGELTNPVYSKKQITKLITETGAEVYRELSVYLDFIIAGKGAKETEDYKQAVNLGLTILSEREVIKYLIK